MAEDVIEMIEKLKLGPVYLAGYALVSGVVYNIAACPRKILKSTIAIY